MTSDAMPPCPTNKRGRHDLMVIIPDSADRPVLIVCSHCGMATLRDLEHDDTPLDDRTAKDIARAASVLHD